MAERLTHPDIAAPLLAPAQSLSAGAAGVALLHIERARAHEGPWDRVHAWLSEATSTPLTTGPQASLFLGAPALAFALASAEGQRRYTATARALDERLNDLTRERLSQAHARIDRGARPSVSEFDLINGLTGLGALWWRRDPHGPLLGEILTYLVRLSTPIRGLPGWWSARPPSGRRARATTGGHSNQGMAHGIGGVLSLLALAARARVTVPGHTEALNRICAWFDEWRQDHHAGPWWPEILTREDLLRGQPLQSRPGRPSWCYGTPGLARAQQLAGLATGDTARCHMAEQALAGCLSDPGQLALLSDHGLCHGTAGVFQASWRAAAEASSSALTAHMGALATRLSGREPDESGGFLRGTAGRALALGTATAGQPPAGGWDSCLLLN